LDFSVLGCRIDTVDRAGAVARVADLAQGASGSLIVTLGVEMVMHAQRDAGYRDLVNGAGLVTCDTIGLLLASRARGGPLRERVTGVELVRALVARSAAHQDLRLYFLGASGDTAQRAARALAAAHPGAQIVGARDGYFSDGESAAVAATIAASGANVLVAGLGFPKQERWIARWGVACGVGAGIGVGGSFDVFAGNIPRAPRAVQAAGMEWAYRLVREPQRWRRQLALPLFVLTEVREIVADRLGKSRP
jgi:N-acetylglucosaminyldiphosphoundecaprenol N-acetyl-beta-D-mannosaminyltransferase